MIDNSKIKELQELVKKKVKNISYEGQMTIVEFEDGEILPLYGGIAGIQGPVKAFRQCSFCGSEGTKDSPVVSLNQNDDPLICSSCVSQAAKTLIENGVDMEIDISNLISQDIIEKMINKK